MQESDSELDALLAAGLDSEDDQTQDTYYHAQPGTKRKHEEQEPGEVEQDDDAIEIRMSKQVKYTQQSQNYQRGMGPFSVLPPEVIYRVLIRLSALDLVNCCLVCKGFRVLGEKDQLWTRLFEQRWAMKIENLQSQNSISCKKRYFERDETELFNTLTNVPKDMIGFYLEMHVAKRQQSPSRDKLSMKNFFVDGEMGQKIRAWRTENGFQVCCKNKPDMSKHHRWKNIEGDVYLCETNGWMHVCGEQCIEKVENRLQGTWVCPISGYAFEGQILVHEVEEQEQEEEADMEFNLAGRLGRAFVDGYNCSSEAEVRNMFSWRFDQKWPQHLLNQFVWDFILQLIQISYRTWVKYQGWQGYYLMRGIDIFFFNRKGSQLNELLQK
eukprot:TRINITY_DN4128_c0_g1_i3.p1 TRINITY_DN4128_c0_g1~~TRINITY_DN4128_c0_g1_i3.p1  ORF type:complete len:398 (+),score=52.18 TRINITY_DN4128_c0_g1_i3:49-1194(+)